MNFRDLSKLLTIAPESSRSNPPKHILCLYHTTLSTYSCKQSCNENKLNPMCFLAKYLDCFTILSLYDQRILINNTIRFSNTVVVTCCLVDTFHLRTCRYSEIKMKRINFKSLLKRVKQCCILLSLRYCI